MELRAYDVYRLGKRSVDRLVERLKRILRDEEVAELAGILVGARDCAELEDRLRPWFAWKSLAWAYSPEGPPPSAKMQVLLEAVCREGLPLDEEFLREVATVGGEETGETGLGAVVE